MPKAIEEFLKEIGNSAAYSTSKRSSRSSGKKKYKSFGEKRRSKYIKKVTTTKSKTPSKPSTPAKKEPTKPTKPAEKPTAPTFDKWLAAVGKGKFSGIKEAQAAYNKEIVNSGKYAPAKEDAGKKTADTSSKS